MPHVSLAVAVTVVVPIGNVLPLGGLATRFGGVQPPPAVTVKNTVAPAGLVATVVMFDGQLMNNERYTVTVKLQLVLLPQLSLAVANTVVVPIGKVLPLGGLAVMLGGGLQPPLALTVKKTLAPLLPVAWTSMFDGQAMDNCGYTVTVKEHIWLLPQVSEAVAVTVVVPMGKVLPLGGLATWFGGVQPPPAVTVKKTVAPAGPVATVVMLEGQLMNNCGYTVTVKLQLVLLPQLSLAVARTVVVPIGKVLPLGGLAVTNGGGLQPPEALTVKKTVAPLGPVAAVTTLLGQAMDSGGYTVTVKLHICVLPQVSLAVAVTVVVPIGNVLPLGGLATRFGGVQPPLAVTVKNTVAPAGPVATVVMLLGQLMVSCRYTVTVKLQLVLLPHESPAVASTVVVPIGKVLPLGGLAVTNGGGLQPPEALTVKKTVAPLGPVAEVTMLDGQAIVSDGTTVTVKLHIALFPQVSLAVAVTVVVPMGNVLPLGGLATIFGGVQPPVAVTVKNTVAPAGPVATVVILLGQLIETELLVGVVPRPMVPGRVIKGVQVAPPSRLTSVKISKKLLIW